MSYKLVRCKHCWLVYACDEGKEPPCYCSICHCQSTYEPIALNAEKAVYQCPRCATSMEVDLSAKLVEKAEPLAKSVIDAREEAHKRLEKAMREIADMKYTDNNDILRAKNIAHKALKGE